MKKNSLSEYLATLGLIILLLCILSPFVFPYMNFQSKASPKVVNQARVENIRLAIQQYKLDYDHYPNSFYELAGNNHRKRIYFSGDTKSTDGNEIFFKVDKNGDGFTDVKSEKIKGGVAVWTSFEEEVIKSWSNKKEN